MLQKAMWLTLQKTWVVVRIVRKEDPLEEVNLVLYHTYEYFYSNELLY